MVNALPYFMRCVSQDIDCNNFRSKNKDLLKRVKELEGINEKLLKDNNDIKYKLDGIMSSQDEIYKKYTDLIIKIANCKC